VSKWKWTLGLVTHNFWWKLLAVAIALATWVAVANEPELATFRTVPVAYRNLPDDVEISSTPTETVSLELRGPANELRALSEGRSTSVILDMSGVAPGQRTFAIGDANINLPRSVEIVRSIPSEVRFDFERHLVRNIPVQVRFAGPADPAFVPGKYSVSPDRVTIAGPASHVKAVQSAVTDMVNLPSAPETVRQRVNAFISDPFVRFIGSPQVEVAVTVKKK
jgi:YbbR domain-containing protein